MALVSPQELEHHLQTTVDAEPAASAIRVAEGWLRSATNLVVWPAPVPEQLWAWAVELAGLAYTNPAGLMSQTVGGMTSAWAVARRKEILDAASAEYPKGQPQGSFPPPQPWPCG